MNEDKNGIDGYIGAEAFAELCFAVSQNLNYLVTDYPRKIDENNFLKQL